MPMSPRLLRPRATGVHPEAAAWRSAVVGAGGAAPSAATMKAVSDFCAAIDKANLRDRFYRLNLMCGPASDSALVAVRTPLYRGQSRTGTQLGNTIDTNVGNLFVPADYKETGTGGGLVGNGSTKYLNTGLAHNVLPQNDSHAAVYEITRASATFRTSLGARASSTTGYLNMGTWNSTANYGFNCFESGGRIDLANSGGGFYVGSINGATDSALYRNGGSKSGNTITTTRTPGSQNLFVFALNDGGSPTGYTDARLAGYSVGLKMSDSEVAAYNSAMQAFQTALGRNV